MNKPDQTPRVLLVDDDIVVRTTLSSVLSVSGFEVRTAGNVTEALRLICSETYDALLSDLHMPGAGDGLTVISAMRHANPRAVTLLLSAFPEMAAATRAILQQTDEILTKPVDVSSLIDVVRQRLSMGPGGSREILSVAEVLARNLGAIMRLWCEQLKKDEKVSPISNAMTQEQRSAHLPQFFHELGNRLRSAQTVAGKQRSSLAAGAHGVRRRQQGYTPAMLVEESRVLQIAIFQTLQSNLANLDFSLLLDGVMTIADEIAFQLSQSMISYLDGTHGDAHRLDRSSMGQAATNAIYGG